MRITIIAAVASNDVIGKNGSIPWHLPADLAHFKRTTTGHTLVMGRRTYESTGALPGRRTLVLTRDPGWRPKGAEKGREAEVEAVRSLDEAIERARAAGETELFVCGGEAVYREALPKAERMVLTRVDAEPEGDTHFPEPDWPRWRLVSREEHQPNEANLHAYALEVYGRP
jgi:dihydrofolate reductase